MKSQRFSFLLPLLLAIVGVYDAWHVIHVFAYHAYGRPADRWDFNVFSLPAADSQNKSVPPYIYDGYLHQPFSKKTSPFSIYFHVLCGCVPSFVGIWQLIDRFRGPISKVNDSHRKLGWLFFAFAFISAVQGCMLAPKMQISHWGITLRTLIVLLGIFEMVCIGISVWAVRAKEITVHRTWALRAWLAMQFFICYARLLIGVGFILTGGYQYSFALFSGVAITTTPILFELIVYWYMVRENIGDQYHILGPLPRDLQALLRVPLLVKAD
jgi:uncharacterized membrane protein YozB (DUF420 family)